MLYHVVLKHTYLYGNTWTASCSVSCSSLIDLFKNLHWQSHEEREGGRVKHRWMTLEIRARKTHTQSKSKNCPNTFLAPVLKATFLEQQKLSVFQPQCNDHIYNLPIILYCFWHYKHPKSCLCETTSFRTGAKNVFRHFSFPLSLSKQQPNFDYTHTE